MITAPGARVVFLDLEDVQSRQNVVQTVCEAAKYPGNPLLPLGRVGEWDERVAAPWATRTVIYDEEDEIFKCWYDGCSFRQASTSFEMAFPTGYAISEDGINWIKPRLGLFEYNGSKDNNICNLGVGCVLKDKGEEDPAKRYKMILKGYAGESRQVRINYSPDGIHWNEGPRINIPEIILNDMVVLMRDDQDPDPQRRYKFVWQVKHPPMRPGEPDQRTNTSAAVGVRAKSIAFGPDIEHFTESPDNPIFTPNDGLEDENHFLMMAPYAGMYVIPYEYGWYVPDERDFLGRYRADIRLAVSRDGEHFQRVQPHQKLISRGRHGEWDDGLLVITQEPVIKDDVIYLYYVGDHSYWTEWMNDENPEAVKAQSGKWETERMGLATLRLDGFTCLETTDRETPGSVTTKPIAVTDRNVQLVLNMGDVQQDESWIEVEVLDAERDEVLDGFSRAECADVCRDAIRVPVTWKKRTLQQLKASRVRLRFWLYGAARLYSFTFVRT